jgi:hypothetical protein
MGAPKGNQFWKLRSKHGRDSIIQDAEVLAKAADEYFQWCIDNPILEKDYRGKDATPVYLEHPRVFQKGEFARFCGLTEWRQLEDLKSKGEDFLQIVTCIGQAIADQKYMYAVCGMFNSNIVARDLGLVDKKEQNVIVEQPLFPD